MKTEDYNYELNPDLIAQTPLTNRSDSSLMIVDRKTGVINHEKFSNIINYMNKGDALVINDSKVLPARLIGVKEDTGAVIEILLLKNISGNVWEALAKPQKKLLDNTIIVFGNGLLKAKVNSKGEDGFTIVTLIYEGVILEKLEQLGTMPLPPYIHEKLEDQSKYQTVYAKEYGSAAAPTAGLHFTKDLISKLISKGVIIVNITLHVGLGTFRPVAVSDTKDHKMHSEYYSLSLESAEILNQVKTRGNKIIAVGTTSVRVLETVMQQYGEFLPSSGETNIFIYPGYKFLAIDMLITNFHLPKSTLLMLVSAFASNEIIKIAYCEAIKKEYRFFSFGDAMFIK